MKKSLTMAKAVLYPETVKNWGMLPVLRLFAARKGVNHTSKHCALDLPVPARAGTYLNTLTQVGRFFYSGAPPLVHTLDGPAPLMSKVKNWGEKIMSKKTFAPPGECITKYYQNLVPNMTASLALMKIEVHEPAEFQRIMTEIETAFLKIWQKETLLAAEKHQATNIIPLKRRSCHA